MNQENHKVRISLNSSRTSLLSMRGVNSFIHFVAILILGIGAVAAVANGGQTYETFLAVMSAVGLAFVVGISWVYSTLAIDAVLALFEIERNTRSLGLIDTGETV